MFRSYFKEMYEKAPIAYQSLDENGIILAVNELWCEQLGYTIDDVVGTWFGNFLCDESRERFRSNFELFKTNGQISNVPFRMICRDGTLVEVRFDGRIGYAEDGSFSRTHCVYKPLTEYQAALDYQENDHTRFNTVFNSTTAAIIVVDLDRYRIMDANAAACSLYGATYRELVKTPLDAISDRSMSPSIADLADMKTAPKAVIMPHTLKDGTVRHMEIFPSFVNFDGGSYVLCIMTDATSRIEADRALKNRLVEQTALAELSALILGHDTSIHQITDSVLETAQKLTGAKFGYVSTIDEATGDNVCHTMSRLMEHCGVNPTNHDDIVFPRRPDGTYPTLWGHSLNTGETFLVNDPENHPASTGLPENHLPLENFCSHPIFIRGKAAGQICLAGKPGGFTEDDLDTLTRIGSVYALAINNTRNIGKITGLNQQLENRVAREIESRQNKERLLVEQKKFADMGHMISAIAHQWRQPLNALGIMVQSLPELRKNEQNLPEHYMDDFVSQAMKLVNLMSGTIDDFRNFFSGNSDSEEFDVLSITSETLSLINARIVAGATTATISCTCPDGDACGEAGEKIRTCSQKATVSSGNPQEFKQALLNIYANAINAIDDSQERNDARIDTRIVSSDRNISITVEDTGGGIDESIMDRIFTPYFTTREQGKGTGLGLSLVRNIIETKMNGSIIAANTDTGARFTITIPRLTAE